MSDLAFTGRTVIVTGGASGIGAATAAAFATRGATVYSLDRAEAAAPIRSIIADVRDRGAVDGAVGRVVTDTGRLDAVVCCAGVTRDAVVWKLTDDDWDTVLDVNLSGAFRVVRAAAPHLRAMGRGAVVLVASINGERGKLGQSNYAASKAGLIAMAKSVARELGRFGTRVNVVSPGMIQTPMTRSLPEEFMKKAVDESALGRPGDPADVANAILFLCSDLARHVTGQVLRVDGGQYM